MMRSFDNKIDYATISVTLHEVVELTEETVTFGDRIAAAFRASWEAFAAFWKGFAVVIVYLIPTLLVIGLILFVVLFCTRKSRKAYRERKAAEKRFYQNRAAQVYAPQQPYQTPETAPSETGMGEPS